MLDYSDKDPTYKPEIPLPKKHNHSHESDDEIPYAPLNAECSQHDGCEVKKRNKRGRKVNKSSQNHKIR